MSDQPEALRLADALESDGTECVCSARSAYDCACDAMWASDCARPAATELRRQHAEIERLTKCLHYEQHLATRIGTHGTGCHAWGPSHYECLLRECERLREYADTLVRERNAAWAESAELRTEVETLRVFAGRVLLAHREHLTDVDGGDVERWALDAGLLERRTVTEPCGDACDCAPYLPTSCFFVTDSGRAAIDPAMEAK